MCKRNSPNTNEATCKRKSLDLKKKVSMGCVRETPQIQMKPARDV